MPKESVRDAERAQAIEITWGRDLCHVQVGVRWDRAILFADEVPAPDEQAVDEALERLRVQLEADGKTLRYEPNPPIELPDLKPYRGMVAAGGWSAPAGTEYLMTNALGHDVPAKEVPDVTSLHVTFTDRRAVNDLIRVLRRARDQAFGPDA